MSLAYSAYWTSRQMVDLQLGVIFMFLDHTTIPV